MNFKCFLSTLKILQTKINFYLDREKVYKVENFVDTEESKNFIIFHVLVVELQAKKIKVFHYAV